MAYENIHFTIKVALLITLFLLINPSLSAGGTINCSDQLRDNRCFNKKHRILEEMCRSITNYEEKKISVNKIYVEVLRNKGIHCADNMDPWIWEPDNYYKMIYWICKKHPDNYISKSVDFILVNYSGQINNKSDCESVLHSLRH